MDAREREARAKVLVEIANAHTWSRVQEEKLRGLSERLLSRSRWREKFSEKYIKEQLMRRISEIQEAGADTAKAGELYEKLVTDHDNYFKKQIVFVPLFGITMASEEVQLGNIRLVNMTERVIHDLVDNVRTVIMGSTSPDDVKKSAFERFRAYVEEFQGSVCAEYRLVAEPEKAQERALEEARRIIDLLRFSIPFLYGNLARRVAIGLQGDITSDTRTILQVSSPVDHFGLSRSRVGPIIDFELNQDNLKVMEQVGVFRLSELLGRDAPLTRFQQSLLDALHWFSNAQTELENEYKFLSLTISLETLLAPSSKDEPITNTIAEGAAIIIAKTLRDRLATKGEVKRLYGIRSAISHGKVSGQLKLVSDYDIAVLTDLVADLIVWALHQVDEFGEQQDLLNWIEVQKLAPIRKQNKGIAKPHG